ncbi:hypothetical protein OHA70_19745 [Kribbella sp. NBC_00382]|uniref:hypothetical protein n=1 Tax=Kribbella sp. NBC_00382 TaxID=2975967 RepID=UPI002E231799
MGFDMVGGGLSPLLGALVALGGIGLIQYLRPRLVPVLVAVRRDGRLVELPASDGQ